MSILDKARETQLRNIEAKTGKSLAEIRLLIQKSGLAKHGEIRQMLKTELGLGHGDANSLVHYALNSDGQSAAQATGASTADVVSELYSGKKAHLRPIHEQLIAEIEKLGAFETVPKKGYVSLRRKKQFAMIGPATQDRIEVGLNMKGVPATDRLVAMPAGGMCQYKVKVTAGDQVDAELLQWLRQAYEAAG
ncbi:MAG TPA: DUF5655 domain-containing protein [Thermoanaerobaculia bacterium]|nr:DUF5655 domain-containing protein [Thermoanaerobaculia bacterium]